MVFPNKSFNFHFIMFGPSPRRHAIWKYLSLYCARSCCNNIAKMSESTQASFHAWTILAHIWAAPGPMRACVRATNSSLLHSSTNLTLFFYQSILPSSRSDSSDNMALALHNWSIFILTHYRCFSCRSTSDYFLKNLC